MRLKNYTIGLYCLMLCIIGYFAYYYAPINLEKVHSFIEVFVPSKDNQEESQNVILIDEKGEYTQDDLVQHVDEDQLPIDFDEQSSQRFIPSLPIQTAENSGKSQANNRAVEPFKVTQHLFTELSKKNFITPKERLQFFKEIGVEYLNKTTFDYAPALELDPRKSEKYLTDIQGCDMLTKLYDADIVAQKLMLLSIRWLGAEVGHGVFAEEDLPEGGFIGVYGGVVQERVLVRDRDYAWSYPGHTLDGGRITLDAAKKGNELRLVNDARDPNCVVKYIIGSDDLWHVCYIAAKNIKKGDQLLISYGPAYWDTRKYKYQELIDIE